MQWIIVSSFRNLPPRSIRFLGTATIAKQKPFQTNQLGYKLSFLQFDFLNILFTLTLTNKIGEYSYGVRC